MSIPCGPSALAVKEAAWGLARYAAISQVLSLLETEIHLRRVVCIVFVHLLGFIMFNVYFH